MRSFNVSATGRKVEVKENMNDTLAAKIRSGSGNRSGGSKANENSNSDENSDGRVKIHKVEISVKTILTILLVIGAIYFGYRLLLVGVLIFFAFVITSAVLPLVSRLEKKGLSRGISVAVVYILFFLLFTALAIVMAVPFAQELQQLNTRLPALFDTVSTKADEITSSITWIDLEGGFVNEILNKLYAILQEGFDSAINTVGTIASLVGYMLVTFALSIYMVLEHDSFLDLLLLQISNRHKRQLVKNLIKDVERKLGTWLVGQGVLSITIGLITWVILTLLDVPFAVPLAVFAGLLESVPNLGPFIASVPAILIGLVAGGPLTGLLVTAGYLLTQQFENMFLVPRVMGNVVGVKPIVVMIGILVGLEIGGIVGAILAVPALVILKIGYEFYKNLQQL